LHHLHTSAKKIVHYDLHPGNVLLNTNKLEDGLKITDFGLSKQ
jgi:serine/threonine protein kinase